MITLESEFQPLAVGFNIYNSIMQSHRRIVAGKQYRITGRLLENEIWYEIEVFDLADNYYKNAAPIFRCKTIGDFYNYLIPKLPSSEAGFKAVLETERRRFFIDEILIDL